MTVEELLSRMTVREKVGQLNQRMHGWTAQRHGELTDEFRAEVTRFDGMGALYGLFRADAWSAVALEDAVDGPGSAAVAAKVQAHLRDHTRLGVPVLLVEEAPHGHQALDGTVFPTNLGLGSTWDPQLVHDVAAAVGGQLRARGVHLALVSALDMLRDPRWGRSEECLSEDPLLAAELTAALVTGMRTAGVGVVLKHFAAQGAGEGGRNAASAPIGERELREIHLPAALAGVRAGAAGIMSAYNDIDGTPCTASTGLLTRILRDEWGFEGIVMADGGAVDRLRELTGGDLVAAGALALRAGVDLSLWDEAYTHIEEALERGDIEEWHLDRACARVLRLKAELISEAELPAWDPAPAEALSLEAARRSIVLLRNEPGTLPLPRDAPLAVIGPGADDVPGQCGDYVAVQRPGWGTSVLAGLQALHTDPLPAGGIVHHPGCHPVDPGRHDIPAAVRLAAETGRAVLVLGGSSARTADTQFADNGAAITVSTATCGEGVDLADVTLPGAQAELLRAVLATGASTTVVLVQGRPHAVPELERADAALCAWYPGPYGGQAVAEVLFGLAEPTGRLPVSLPRSATALPCAYNRRLGPPGDYADGPSTSLFPFGAGPQAPGLQADLTAVTNHGDRTATGVVRVFARRLRGDTWPRARELAAFRRVTLAPGEKRDLHLALPDDPTIDYTVEI